jgi:hypothetical protein
MSSTTPARFDVDALARWRADGTEHRILDVRTPAEFETVHIPGSYNLPLDQLGEHREELARHVDEPVVLVCRSGNRAGRPSSGSPPRACRNVHVLDGRDDGLGGRRQGGRAAVSSAGTSSGRSASSPACSSCSGSSAASSCPLKYLSGAVGAGLTFAALTNTCAMGMLLAKLPYNRTVPSCDVDTIVGQLTGKR